jgi:N-acetylneuraminate synthase
MNFKIGEIEIGPDNPPVVVTELGINHGGSISEAKKLVDLAILNGAKIIKHQTHIPDAEMSKEARNVIPGNSDKSIYDVISECVLTLDEETQLAEYVRNKGVIYISTPFSFEAIEFLESIDVPAYKIGSGECNNYPFVREIASKGKPVIMSTGMNSIKSIEPSVRILEKYKVPYALLHCTNLYPTPEKLIRLNAINELSKNFPNAVLGLSDHSTSNYPCLGAVALGASILERHFTDSKDRIGPDIVCSMTPTELNELITGSQIIYLASKGSKIPVDEETVTSDFAFASVVATRNLPVNHVLTRSDITLKRPNGGDFGPSDFDGLIGKVTSKPIEENVQIKFDQLRA